MRRSGKTGIGLLLAGWAAAVGFSHGTVLGAASGTNATATSTFVMPETAGPPALAESPGVSTNLLDFSAFAGPTNRFAANTSTNAGLEQFADRLANARYLAKTRQFTLAKPALVKLLDREVPDSIQRAALFELGTVAQAENDLPRAQSIYQQFLNRWSDDVQVPEVLLRQGQVFRQMGLNDLALGKFYSVMTAALSLKQSQFNYYRQLVLQAQIEIAETNFKSGKFADAAEFYSRLLKSPVSALDHAEIQFLLIRALVAARNYDRAAGEARDFLAQHADNLREPEVRYYLAESLKAEGRNGDALQQVVLFLKQEQARAKAQPEVWSYWQQRVGNEIGNQLYQDGDYLKALEVYQNLAQLNPADTWQLPVKYQIGLTYERLLQPEKARAVYQQIVARESSLGTNATPEIKTVLDMSRWRIGFIDWQNRAQAENRSLAGSPGPDSAARP
jgi:tetratricopeptide (TPR) repeat protein